MQRVESFQSSNLIFTFEPPLEVVGGIETVGQLVGQTIVGRLVNSDPSLAHKISEPIQRQIDVNMNQNPELAVRQIQQELQGHHKVVVRSVPLF
jgi:hypothetical protein